MGGRVWAVWSDLVLSLEVIWGSRWVVAGALWSDIGELGSDLFGENGTDGAAPVFRAEGGV